MARCNCTLLNSFWVSMSMEEENTVWNILVSRIHSLFCFPHNYKDIPGMAGVKHPTHIWRPYMWRGHHKFQPDYLCCMSSPLSHNPLSCRLPKATRADKSLKKNEKKKPPNFRFHQLHIDCQLPFLKVAPNLGLQSPGLDLPDRGVFFSNEEKLEQEIDKPIGAASAVMKAMYWSVLVKREPESKGKNTGWSTFLLSSMFKSFWVVTEKIWSLIQTVSMSFFRMVSVLSLRGGVRSSVIREVTQNIQ